MDVITSNLTLFFWAVVLPLFLAGLLALPFWLRRSITAGNIVGSVLIVLATTVLIWYQYGATLEAQSQCVASGTSNCYTDMQDIYLPFLILVVLGWVNVFLLLVISGVVEDRIKKKRRMRKELF